MNKVFKSLLLIISLLTCTLPLYNKEKFILKYSGSGSVDMDPTAGTDVKDPQNGADFYLTGWFSGIIDFDSGIGIDQRTAIGGKVIFILKLNQ